LVAIGAALFLGDKITGAGVVAVMLVVGGIVWIGLSGARHGVGWAVTTGLFITAYTLVDGHAVRTLDSALDYTATLFLGNALLYVVTALGIRGFGRFRRGIRENWWQQLFGGSASVLAYTLVLVAARIAPLGLVSAVRETSVIIGALAGWLILREPLGPRRVAAAGAIAAGLAIIAV
jgi:drug/metabolite transporter (DMT)-like permease